MGIRYYRKDSVAPSIAVVLGADFLVSLSGDGVAEGQPLVVVSDGRQYRNGDKGSYSEVMNMRGFSRMSQAQAPSSYDGDGLTSTLGGATVVTIQAPPVKERHFSGTGTN